MDYNKASLELHKNNQGKIEVISKVDVKTQQDLSTAYSPGVAAPCLEIEQDETNYKTYTSAGSTVAVISNGSAILGLGNLGAKPAMPVMEGKCVLFKEFGGVNAYPLVVNSQDTEEFITTIKAIAPSFGGINLEDIAAPQCFEIEQRLKKELPIPVFHDDQHGTAIVTLAGIINYLKLTNKKKENLKIVINGSGAAGTAIAKLLYYYGCRDIIMCDRKGALSKKRDDLDELKKELLTFTNLDNEYGTLFNVLENADIFIGVSAGGLLQKEDIETMNDNPAVFAMANPIPEIMPEEAKKGGAYVVATGRSDFENQLNNVLVFPGIFKGALQKEVNDITDDIKIAAAEGLAGIITNPTPQKIIPGPFDKAVAQEVAQAVIHSNN